MGDTKVFLEDWIVDFIKNKDAIFKRIVSIEKNKDGFDIVVNYKDKSQYMIIAPIIINLDEILEKFNEDKNYGLVVANTQNNFRVIVENWQKLIKIRLLCIYLVNPFSNLDKKWLIYPATHNRICDETSLKTGLKSMFEMVEPLTDNQIESRFCKS